MILEIAISLFAVWILYFILTTCEERKNGIPGPFPLPLIGNLHQLGSDPPFTMDKLCEKYGDVYKVRFPVGTFVIVNSGEAAREALVTRKDDFAGRPINLMYPIDIIMEGKDIGNIDCGPQLMFRRKLLISALHVFGERMLEIEERVNGAVTELIEQTAEMDGKAFYLQDYVSAAIASQLWEWVSSKKYGFGDPNLKAILNFNERITALFRLGSYYQMLPLLTYLPTNFNKNIKQVIKMRDTIFGCELEEHCRSYKEGVIRDVTDALISAYEIEKSKNSGKDIGLIGDLKFIMFDIILAGADTSKSVIGWCILFIVLNKDIQEKLQNELDREVGRDRLPRWADVKNLPHLQSFVCEVMRYSSLIPFAAHKTMRNTTIKGYHIPKNTPVFFNFYRIHKNAKEWVEPASFKPDRFLDSDGNFVGWTTIKAFLPFGIGRRSCVGQDLGKMQVFSILASLLHQFTLDVPNDEPEPSLEDTVSTLVHRPKNYKVVPRKRS